MGFVIIQKGVMHVAAPNVSITKAAKLITFSAGFMRMVSVPNVKYVRMAYDADIKALAFEFITELTTAVECFKMNEKSSPSVTANSLLNNFNLSIDDIVGTYEGDALEGPINVPGFSERAFIVHLDKKNIN